MLVIAHIGNIPVEEWLPFVAPVVAVYLFVRRQERRRREAVQRLPAARELLDEPTVARVLERLSDCDHGDARARHLPVLYPPGPDGLTATALANRTHCDTPTVERLLVELEDLGYLELEGEDGGAEKALLTVEGHDLVNLVEQELLAVAHEREPALSG